MSMDINRTHARWGNAGLAQIQEVEEVCELLWLWENGPEEPKPLAIVSFRVYY
jgi:hypothetical protein